MGPCPNRPGEYSDTGRKIPGGSEGVIIEREDDTGWVGEEGG